MTAPATKPPEEQPDNPLYLLTLRLLVLCFFIIIGFGLSNYVLNWIVARYFS